MSQLDQMTLTAGDKSMILPVIQPVLGQPCVDIAKLPKETGCFTYDPGFGATASCKSAITYIDGDARASCCIAATRSSNWRSTPASLEVAYLLMNGELPTAGEFNGFEHEVTHHTMMHEAFRSLPVRLPPRCASDGDAGRACSGRWPAFYHDDLDLEDAEQRRMAAIRLIAKIPTIAAACHRYSIGWPIGYPRNNLDYTTRFLHMMIGSAERAAGVEPGRSQGDGFAVHPARRPRTECLDLHRAPGGLYRRQSLSLASRRAWRRCGVRPMAVPMRPC